MLDPARATMLHALILPALHIAQEAGGSVAKVAFPVAIPSR
jgi:hypothetical protein